jgi:hypothetical protein
MLAIAVNRNHIKLAERSKPPAGTLPNIYIGRYRSSSSSRVSSMAFILVLFAAFLVLAARWPVYVVGQAGFSSNSRSLALLIYIDRHS